MPQTETRPIKVQFLLADGRVLSEQYCDPRGYADWATDWAGGTVGFKLQHGHVTFVLIAGVTGHLYLF